MKKFLLLLFVPCTLFAQIPANYYSIAENKADASLKYELNQIIDNHVEFSYSSSSTDTWDILSETDKDPSNPSNVILIYSGISVNAAQEYNSGNGWTREHIWAKSRGDFGNDRGPGTDVHALRPLDNSMNSARSNRGFDNCSDCSDVYDQWSNYTGSKKDNTDWSFEPRDAVKGDVARMLFYMAVRYEGYDSHVDLELSEIILPSSDKTPFHGILSTLLDWHRNDPVDAWEENRNDIIYNNYQNNRNPFIDYPELAEHLWGNQTGVNWTISSLSVDDTIAATITIYPNPASTILNIEGVEHDYRYELIDLLGRTISSGNLNSTSVDISSIEKGQYLIRVANDNQQLVKQISIR